MRKVASKAKLVDQTRINETLQRYQVLLNDPSSPFMSNFLSLLGYRDGSDFMSLEEFYE